MTLSQLDRAIELAIHAHAGQTDKAGAPYILHPLRVMLRLDSEEKRIAAVLHDTVEDCGVKLSSIREQFGDAVAEAVNALSRRDGESYEAFIDRCGTNEIARAVKWADLSDNMDMSRIAEPTAADRARQEKYRSAIARLSRSSSLSA